MPLNKERRKISARKPLRVLAALCAIFMLEAWARADTTTPQSGEPRDQAAKPNDIIETAPARSLSEVTRDLDSIERRFEQYGTITLSTPLLVRASSRAGQSAFAFDLSKTTNDFFQDARTNIQGRIAVASQRLFDLQVQARASEDPTLKAAYDQQLLERQAALEAARTAQQEAAVAAKAKYDAAIAAANAENDAAVRATKVAAAVDGYRADLRDIFPAAGTVPTSNSVGTLPSATTAINSPTISSMSSLADQAEPFQLLDALGDTSPTVTNRAAIIAAAGDSTVSGIFKILGDPGRQLALSGQQAFFGVTMVSVIPGRRTERNYAGNIAVVATIQVRRADGGAVKNLLARWEKEYSLQADVQTRIACDVDLGSTCSNAAPSQSLLPPEARQRAQGAITIPDSAAAYGMLPPAIKGGVGFSTELFPGCAVENLASGEPCYLTDTDNLPTVAAVSPMTEAQVLDSGSSSRQRRQIALDLAAALRQAGSEEASRVFMQYAAQTQADAVTRAPENYVAAYSSGRVFGYDIGPGFTALDDPTLGEAKPGRRLQRQSFPALIIIGIKPELAQSKIYLVPTANGQQKLLVLTPSIYLAQTSRWMPRGFFKIMRSRFTEGESDRLEWAQAIEEANGVASSERTNAASGIYYRTIAIEALTGLSGSTIPIPEPEAAEVTTATSLIGISPSTFTLNRDGNGKASDTKGAFLVQGQAVDVLAANPLIFVNGKPLSGALFTPYGTTAGLLQVPFRSSDVGVMFVSFPASTGSGAVRPAALVGPVEVK